MAEYWKSQAKKYCDFCKCWITDNKPSVQFHERGKRHKENVAKRLKEITKKSKKEFKSQLRLEDEIKKMEDAGMKAYMHDVEANADYSSGILRKEIGLDTCPGPSKNTNVWHEAKKGNQTYYWNSNTGESTFEKPKEFISIQEQSDLVKMYHVKKMADEQELVKKQSLEANEEIKAKQLREKMKSRKVDSSEPPTFFGPILPETNDNSPYGQWTTVDNSKKIKIDLQLPSKPSEPPIEFVKLKKPKFTFNEKVITQLKEEDNISPKEFQFKKRKNNGNLRKRTECD